jgi:hypothetical protein
MEAPERANLRAALQGLAIAIVIGSGAAFLTGMNMVAVAVAERSSSHPKGPREQRETPKQQRAPVVQPSQRVELLDNIVYPLSGGTAPDQRGV